MIEDLLDVSRIMTGKLVLESQPIEMGRVVADAANTTRPAAVAKNIEIETNLSDQPAIVLGDTNRLQQAVWNLLSNAVKFTPEGGRVKIDLGCVDSHVVLTVRDTGQGITPEFLPHVFDRFRQADGTTTRAHGGLGLGLAIVRHLVELHGGTVEAHSDGEGRGATFTLRLPLLGTGSWKASTSLRHRPPTGAEIPSPPIIECPPKLDGLRVLVVDDDPDTCDMLEVLLVNCDAEVVKARSVAEALGEIEKRMPDVLVSDIGMPGEDGYELISQVRAREAERGGRTLPALALTAYAKADDRVRALAAGFQFHLAKPVEPAEFALLVANLAGRGSGQG